MSAKKIMAENTGHTEVNVADEKDEREVKEIIQKIKSGDKRAFGELVKRYRNQVASLAYKMVGDQDDAADITQNVFVKTSQNYGSI